VWVKHYHEDLWVSPNVTDFSELDCEQLPDYLNDLNAMHEAEATRGFHYDQRWIESLVQIGLRECALTLDRTDGWDWALVCARSTAARRAEAFLRTLNLWTND
jgi:hypothetical protein